MSIQTIDRVRPDEDLQRTRKLLGEYKLAAQSGLATTLAAATTTAGHVFCMRNPHATASAVIRFLNVNFITTTGFTTIQPMAYDVIMGRSSSVVYTGGTAIDLGSTLASPKLRTGAPTSIFGVVNNVRIASTTALVAGTQTLDAMPLAQKGGVGATTIAASFDALLWDSRDSGASTIRSPLVIGPSEVMVVRNVILMGAAGVGYITVNVEWDEVA
jgi:hypothetical protein